MQIVFTYRLQRQRRENHCKITAFFLNNQEIRGVKCDKVARMIKLQSGDYDFAVICDKVNPHFATLMWQNEQSLPHNSRSLAKSLVKPRKITIFAFGNEKQTKQTNPTQQ